MTFFQILKVLSEIGLIAEILSVVINIKVIIKNHKITRGQALELIFDLSMIAIHIYLGYFI
mgnify:FL=1